MKPWNFGKPKVPGSGNKLPIPEHHNEIVRLYVEDKLSPRQIGERIMPERPSARTTVRTILRRRGVPLRDHRDACLAFHRTNGRVRRGPKHD